MIEELKALAEKASQIDDDIRYYSGGSKHNEAAEQLTALVRSNLPAILSALSAVPVMKEALEAWAHYNDHDDESGVEMMLNYDTALTLTRQALAALEGK